MKLLQIVSLAIPLLLAPPALSAASICCIEIGGGFCDRAAAASSFAQLADPTIELVNEEGKAVSPEFLSKCDVQILPENGRSRWNFSFLFYADLPTPECGMNLPSCEEVLIVDDRPRSLKPYEKHLIEIQSFEAASTLAYCEDNFRCHRIPDLDAGEAQNDQMIASRTACQLYPSFCRNFFFGVVSSSSSQGHIIASDSSSFPFCFFQQIPNLTEPDHRPPASDTSIVVNDLVLSAGVGLGPPGRLHWLSALRSSSSVDRPRPPHLLFSSLNANAVVTSSSTGAVIFYRPLPFEVQAAKQAAVAPSPNLLENRLPSGSLPPATNLMWTNPKACPKIQSRLRPIPMASSFYHHPLFFQSYLNLDLHSAVRPCTVCIIVLADLFGLVEGTENVVVNPNDIGFDLDQVAKLLRG
ncbi:hypothetical protein GALMADRAFT_1326093 [Galerina marginata CBS 339.88]|uniref:Uncharacterized protein n=1 Tax=Galerina marginata (strain CBS 339.88) TaxID=685588 RepID=A0A067U406_GALM3|nr:hypothetical protein GALMADRAFT_1326093 [Galerina marginata CBS 339.88]